MVEIDKCSNLTPHDLKSLSQPIEESVSSHGASPDAVWLDKSNTLEKGTQRCDAVFRMMQSSQNESTILDLGCGPGLSLAYLEDRFGPMVGRYLGIDISEPLIAAARSAWPHHKFQVRNIISDPLTDSPRDFTAINGVLTAKYSLTHGVMEKFVQEFLTAAWQSTSVAMSFNVMSVHVDWKREDLFHWPVDRALEFCISRLSRHVNIIADYGLYEYTVQIFREPHPQSPIPVAWRTTESI